MTQIRGKNEGSIHQRKNGTWRVQVSLEGRRMSFTAGTRRECQEWLKKAIVEIDQGLTFASTSLILGDYLRNWLDIIKTSKRYNTWLGYEQLTRNYVIPHLGKERLHSLRPDQIQSFYGHLLATKVGAYTISKIHILLHSAFEQALRLGLVSRNVTQAAIPPRLPVEEMNILDESQASQMLLAAQGTRLEAILQLAVTTGMRQMELLGLKWTDLDWIKQMLKVERQLERSTIDQVRFTQPKTKHGRRNIALGDQTIAALRRHYERQNEERVAMGEGWVEHDLIFTCQTGTPINQRNLLRDFKLLLVKAGLPMIRFHDLRHTAASLMLNHGISVMVVSRRLGHARPSITLDVYGHLIPSMENEAAQKIDEWITPIAIARFRTEKDLHPTAPDLHPLEVHVGPDPNRTPIGGG